MKKNLLFFIFSILSFIAQSQVSINNYSFATSGNASLNRSNGSLIDDIDMTTGTTVVLGGSAVTNTISSSANLNFDFYSGGQRFTNFTVTPNGWVGLGGGVSPVFLWSNVVTSGTRIAPFLGPLLNTNVPPLGSMTTSSIGRVHYKLIGTSPSRVGVIEFLRMSINSSVVDDTNTFQVRLYESNGAIEMVYGRMKLTSGAPLNFNIGFKMPSGSHSVDATSHTSSTTVTNTNTYTTNTFIPNLHNYTPGNQRSYIFTPTSPNNPSNFNISNVTNNSMTLTWNDASNETSYVLYRSIDGGANYTFVTQLPANTITYNATGLPSNTDVYWRLFSVRESIGSQQDNMATTSASTVVSSVKSGFWSDPTTWSSGVVPFNSDSVLISANDTVVLNMNNAICLRLTIDGALHYNTSGSNLLTILTDLQVNSSGSLKSLASSTSTGALSVGGQNTTSTTNGSIINNGIIDLEQGFGVTTNMFGNGNSTISGTGSVYKFRILQIQKNNNINNIVDVINPFSVAILANINSLVVNSGTLRLSCAINLTPYGVTTGGGIVSGLNGKLWLNHANAVVNTTTTPPSFSFTPQWSINGELRIDNGIFNIGFGNSLLVINNGLLNINGGTINILGGFQSNSTGTFTLINGIINIDPISGSNALPAGTPAFSAGVNSNLNITGGVINIINPQQALNSVTLNVLSGGSKSVTGGLLKIGNGMQNGTLPNLSNVAGFGLNSQIPFYNVTIDNRFDLSTGRLVRIVNTFKAKGTLILSAGGTILPASGNNGGAIILEGDFVNNGQIIGNFPITSAPIVGLVSFEGTSAQTISGTGTFSNLANLTVKNPNGVNSTLSNFGNVVRVNLLTGLLTTNGSLVIGSTISRGTVQIGGLNETSAAGSFSSTPLFNPTFTSHRYIYGASSSALSIGLYNEIPAGTATFSSLTILDQDGLLANRDVNVLDTLNLGSSNLDIGNNTLNIGNSVSQAGSLLRTSGFVKMDNAGTFGRWYATGTVLNNNLVLGFPILCANQNRSLTLNSDGNPITSGGKFTVKHQNINGYTNLITPITDGFLNVNRVSNSNWILNSSGIVVSPSFGLQVNAQIQGIGSISSLSDLRWLKPSLSSGGTSNGAGTLSNPIISRLFSQAQVSGGITNDTFFLGVSSLTNSLIPTFIAVNNGSWDNPSTWNNNAIPDATNLVIIPQPYAVSLSAFASQNACDSLVVLSGGTLNIGISTLNVSRNVLCDGTINQSGGNFNITGLEQAGFNIGATTGTFLINGGTCNIGLTGGSNRTMQVDGSLTIGSNGNLIVNGNVSLSSTAQFTQTGGNFSIDGNSGIAFTSVLSGKHLLDINTNNISCSAGTITFVDPPHFTLGVLSTHTLRIAAVSNTSAFSGTHTVIFGNGISAEIGNSSGFNVDNRKVGFIPLQNIVVNGGNISGRWTSSSFSSGSFGLYVKGNVTINNGSELRQTNASQLALGGNIINNGILTSSHTLTIGGLGYNITNTQTLSGTGIYRSLVTGSTSEFNTLSINNGGTLFNLTNNTFRVATALNLVSGMVSLGTNTLKVLSSGNINRVGGYIENGSLELNFPLGTNVSKTFFVGSINGYTPVVVNFPVVTNQGDLRLTINNTDHPQISAACLNNLKSINKYWTLNNVSVLPYNLNADFSFQTNDLDLGTNTSSLIGKSFNGVNWNNVSLNTIANNNFTINSVTNNIELQLAETATLTPSVSITASSNSICSTTNVVFTASPISGGNNPSYQWKKNGIVVGTNANIYSDNTLLNNDQISCELTSNLACASSNTASSNIITMIVYGSTVAGNIIGSSSICAGSVGGTLTLTGQSGTINNWESAVAPFTNWNTIANTTTTLNPGIISQNTQYRVLVQNGACNAVYSSIATISTNGVSVGGNISGPTSVCGTSNGDSLTLNNYVGNILRWESAVPPYTNWSAVSVQTSKLNIGAILQTTIFRALVQNNTCTPVYSDTALVSLVTTSIGGSVNGGSQICEGSNSGLLQLSGNTGSVLRWESAIAPFNNWTPIANPVATYTANSLLQTTQFRAVVQNGSCASAISSPATVTVSSLSFGGSVSGSTTICSGSSAGTLNLLLQNGAVVRWEKSISPFTSWTTISNTNTSLMVGILNDTTKYRAIVQNGVCGESISTTATINVNQNAFAGTLSGPNNICAGSNPGILNLNNHIGNVVGWQSAVSPFTFWNNISNTTTSYNPGALTQTTQFRAIVQNSTCGADTSTPLSINISTAVLGGNVNALFSSVCSGIAPSQNINLNNFSGSVSTWQKASGLPPYTWINISGSAFQSSITPAAETNTTAYRALVQSGTCGSAVSDSIVIGINTPSVGGILAGNNQTCFNSNVQLSLIGNNGTIVRWESAVSPFTNWTNMGSTANPFTSNTIVTTTQFRAIVKNGVCPETSSNIQSVNIISNNTWLGTVSNDWNDVLNWTCGIPTANTDVIIGGNLPAFGMPQVFTNANAKNIDILGGNLTNPAGLITLGNNATLSLYGNLSLNNGVNGLGAINVAAGTVILNGNNNQLVSTPTNTSLAKGTILFQNLTIAGSGNKTFENLTSIVNNNLNLNSGYLLLNDSFTLATNANIIGGNANSYIKTNMGRLIQNNIGIGGKLGNVLFPVGTTNSYLPVTINNAGTADNFSVKVIPSVFESYANEIGSSIKTNNAVDYTWFVNEQIPGGSNISINLQWNDFDELNGFNRTNCYVASNNGSSWTSSSAGIALGANPFNKTISGLNNLGIFGVGSSGTLPVKLVSFTGKLINKTTHLNWVTANEINNSHFEIERSINGSDFENIGSLKGAGNSNRTIKYRFDDNSLIVNNLNKSIYYRLKQVDFDGKFEYTQIIVVSANENDLEKNNSMLITPNPFQNIIQFNFTSSINTTANIAITDALGREVYTKNLVVSIGDNELVLNDIASLQSGIYFIKIDGNGIDNKIVKLLKN